MKITDLSPVLHVIMFSLVSHNYSCAFRQSVEALSGESIVVLSFSSDENIGKNLLSGYIPLLMVPSAYKLAVTCLLVFTSSFISYCVIVPLITISEQVKI